MIVTVLGLSGDTNAYRSVLSAVGSCEMSGASAWLEAFACFGCRLLAVRPTPRAAATAIPAARGLRGLTCFLLLRYLSVGRCRRPSFGGTAREVRSVGGFA